MALDPRLSQAQQQGGTVPSNVARLMPQNYNNQPRPKNTFGQNLYEGLFGSEGGYDQVYNYAPHQRAGLDFIFSDALSQLQNPYAGFQPIQDEYTRMFNNEIVPGIAEKFVSQSGGAGLSSPGLGGQLREGGQGLASMLAAQKANYGLQNRQQALQQAQLGSTQQFENVAYEGSEGLVQKALPVLADAAMLYATGGTMDAKGISNMIGKGVDAWNDGKARKAAEKKWTGMTPRAQKNMLNDYRWNKQLPNRLQQGAQRAQSIQAQYPNLGPLDNTSISSNYYPAQQKSPWSFQ